MILIYFPCTPWRWMPFGTFLTWRKHRNMEFGWLCFRLCIMSPCGWFAMLQGFKGWVKDIEQAGKAEGRQG